MPLRWTLSAFADEIGPDLDLQIKVMNEAGVRRLDLRSVDDTNLIHLTDDRIRELQSRCRYNGIEIEAIGSPVNKITYSPEAGQAEMDKLRRSIEIAHLTGANKIRIFSPHITEGEEEAQWPQVLDYMRQMADLGAVENVVLMHENDGRFIGAYPPYAQRMLTALGGPHFRAIYDFANPVYLGFRPMRDWFPWLLPHLVTVHIKDSMADGKVVLPGQGEGQMAETFAFLAEQGWQGTLTMEPHLVSGGAYGGFAGPDLFKQAVEATRELAAQAGAELE